MIQTAADSTDLPWWIPVPWILAALGILVALLAYRRNRYPLLRLLNVSCHGEAGAPRWRDVARLTVELECVGADIYDFEMRLVVAYARRPRSWTDELRLQFWSRVELPNPLKHGQVVRVELTDSHLKKALVLNGGYHCLPSQLPWNRVWLEASRSGRRTVRRFGSWRFRRALRCFDSEADKFVREGAQRDGLSHYYSQQLGDIDEDPLEWTPAPSGVPCIPLYDADGGRTIGLVDLAQFHFLSTQAFESPSPRSGYWISKQTLEILENDGGADSGLLTILRTALNGREGFYLQLTADRVDDAWHPDAAS